jgi:hypothetical protein
MSELKPEFKEKLLKAKVLTKWKKNFNERYPERKKDYGSLNDYDEFSRFISTSFVWMDSPDGHDFWCKISNS